MPVATVPRSVGGDRAATRRAVLNTLKGSSGNLVEWYDVYVFAVFGVYFAPVFFGGNEPNAGIYTAAIFAVTFIMRPVGSWFFGVFADRRGRRPALMAGILLMAAGSMVIAIIPGKSAIGPWAVVILVLCRLVQGFATGGEYGTSATYMSEAATRERRGFFSSFQYLTLVGGAVLAQLTLLILQVFLDKSEMQSFGWRIAFGIGGVAAVVVLWMRTSMDESLSDRDLEAVRDGERPPSSLRYLLTAQWRPLLLCFLITMGGTLCFYVYSVNSPAIVKKAYADHGMTPTWINLSGLIFLMVLQPVGGLISDKIGRKPLLIWFGAGALVYTYFLITYLPKVTSPIVSFLLVAVSYIFLTGYTSINAIVKAELFPVHIRALGVGLGYAAANSAFGGTAPLIYEALKKADRVPTFIAYVMALVGISLLVYIFALRNKSSTHLDQEQGYAYQAS
jgi:MHS family alpha-ketoglutarate permease-like MFS transporter